MQLLVAGGVDYLFPAVRFASPVDYVGLARSCHAYGERVEAREDLGAAIDRGLGGARWSVRGAGHRADPSLSCRDGSNDALEARRDVRMTVFASSCGPLRWVKGAFTLLRATLKSRRPRRIGRSADRPIVSSGRPNAQLLSKDA
jgi:hypothetical protein